MAEIEGNRPWWEMAPRCASPATRDPDWLELRARAPMRQSAAKANRRRARPEQADVAGLALFEPPLV